MTPSVVARELCPAHRRGSTHGSSTEGLGRTGTGVTPQEHIDLDEVWGFLEQIYAEACPPAPRPHPGGKDVGGEPGVVVVTGW